MVGQAATLQIDFISVIGVDLRLLTIYKLLLIIDYFSVHSVCSVANLKPCKSVSEFVFFVLFMLIRDILSIDNSL